MTMTRIFLFLTAALFFTTALPERSNGAGAPDPFAGTDTSAPVRIDADTLEVIRPEGVAVFSGNVRAVQGTLTITGDEMRVYYSEKKQENDAAGVKKIEIVGSVKIDNGRDSAVGDAGVYDAEKNIVMLEGENLALSSGPHTLTGARLIYDIASGRSRLEGADTQAAGKPRVSGVFVPGKD